MKKIIPLSVSFILSFFACGFAQQSGTYTSEMVEARTRSRDASGNPQLSAWKPFETRLIDNLNDFHPVTTPSFNRYGSSTRIRLSSSGFFRTEKVGDRWWVIDPEGYPALNITVNSVNMGSSDRNKKAFSSLFKNTADWMAQTKQQLIGMGFTGAGSWSDSPSIISDNAANHTPFSYTVNLSLMSGYGRQRGGVHTVPGHTGFAGNATFVFDPGFEKYCEEQAKQLLKYKKDPNLFGYFSDNELPFNLKNLDGYLSLDPQEPGHQAAKKWLQDNNLSVGQIDDTVRTEFLAFVAHRYFSIVRNAIKKYDPNHLYLGCRFYSSEKNIPEFMKAAGPYLDVVSINYYGVWTPSQKYMNNWASWTGKPFIITEFYTKGMDSGLPNTSGAGWVVKTQEDRGKAYQNFCMALLENKNCVGWHWFKYQDNDPTDKNAEPSNTDANKGIVDNNYRVYEALASKMKQLNLNRFELITYFDNIHNND